MILLVYILFYDVFLIFNSYAVFSVVFLALTLLLSIVSLFAYV